MPGSTPRSTSSSSVSRVSDPASPEHPPVPPVVPGPGSAEAARKLLHSLKLLDSKSAPVNYFLLLGLLAKAARLPDVPATATSIIESVIQLFPEVLDPSKQISADLASISEKLDGLAAQVSSTASLESQLAPIAESITKTQASAELAEANAIETQKSMLALCDQLALHEPGQPPPSFAPPHDTAFCNQSLAGMHPDRRNRLAEPQPHPGSYAEAAAQPPFARDYPQPPRTDARPSSKTIAQSCKILVQPNGEPASEALDKLSARELVVKGELTAENAWKSIRDTDFTAKEGRMEKPILEFRAAARLPRGGIEYTMGSTEQANWLSLAPVAIAFEKHFGDPVTVKGQHVWVLAERVSVNFPTDNSEAIRTLERDNDLDEGDILSAYWMKPEWRRTPNQLRAHLKLELRSMNVADALIESGCRIEYTISNIKRIEEDPTRCLKCQHFGHIATKCSAPADICSHCGGDHRSNVCSNKDKHFCVNCKVSEHSSWSRACPKFIAERDALNHRKPDNRRRFFSPLHPCFVSNSASAPAPPHGLPKRPLSDVIHLASGAQVPSRQTTLHHFQRRARPVSPVAPMRARHTSVPWGDMDMDFGTPEAPPLASPRPMLSRAVTPLVPGGSVPAHSTSDTTPHLFRPPMASQPTTPVYPLRPASPASSISSLDSVGTVKAFSPSRPSHV